MLSKPERPFKDLSDARRRICLFGDHDRLADLRFFPCVHCDGRGGVRKIEDLDPIEGYKMAPLYPCPECNGSGAMPRKKFVQHYNAVMRAWKAELAEYRRQKAILKSAKGKLTGEEYDAITRGSR